MSSIFRKDDNYVDKPKRNTFDMSHQNNLSLKFGKLVPVMCQEVIPGDTVKIDPSFGLRYMPQVFPVQTRQRASIKFYYVRNRNLWKDWPDFIGKTKQGLTPPYLKFERRQNFKYLQPSSLADYLGVPVKINKTQGYKSFLLNSPNANQGVDKAYIPNSDTVFSSNYGDYSAILSRNKILKSFFKPTIEGWETTCFRLSDLYGAQAGAQSVLPYSTLTDNPSLQNGFVELKYVGFALLRQAFVPRPTMSFKCVGAECFYCIFRTNSGVDVIEPLTFANGTWNFSRNNYDITYRSYDKNTESYSVITESIKYIVGVIYAASSSSLNEISLTDWSVYADIQENDNMYWSDVDNSDLPFCNDKNNAGIRISALPFRAIESIYNALIRNAENNPFRIDGVPEYNKYITSDEGGAVTDLPNLLKDYYANWADDRFTTALPSPQQGNAPLVGLTGVNGATLTTSTEDGTTSTLHLQVDSDTGNVILVDGVSSDAPEYLNDAMMSAVEYGITINDLRNVNSFQRWLENNIRKGYKYKDQLMAHYGVHARYDVLDMPEFIGGVTRDVNVQQITQSVKNEYGELGEYGGISSVMGEGHSIEHYCDEHGFIIGLLCVTPMPLYQDTLPKFLIKSDPFDYYFPEFGKIGMQPITNKELAFSQSVIDGSKDETFGYQRAWYDYLENIDTVHGLFRSDLRNFLIARDFYDVPQLGEQFLTMNSDDVNNTFYVDDDKDKIIGQIYFHMSMKRPIPMVGIPSLE